MNDSSVLLRDKIASWLQGQGHKANVNAIDERFGEVSFRARGLWFGVRVDETDPGFLYITLSMGLPDDVLDELAALRAAALTASSVKVVKVESAGESGPSRSQPNSSSPSREAGHLLESRVHP